MSLKSVFESVLELRAFLIVVRVAESSGVSLHDEAAERRQRERPAQGLVS